jgi:muconate cycloisomerase
MPLDHAVAARLARPITIRAVEAIPVALPLTKPMKMAGVELTTAENLLVRIEAADGTVGWGEAASAPTMTGDTLPAMVAAVRDHLAPLLVGKDARGRAALVARMAHAMHLNTGARSAVEIALADLVGRTLGVGFVDLYGGALRSSVEPMWLVGNATAGEDIAEARTRMRDGYAFFKLKVGVKRVEEEIETALAVRAALGAGVTLCADANGGFDYPRATRYLAGVREAGLAFLEQPLAAANLAGLARLARTTAIPLGADEGIHSLADVEAHAGAGVGGLSLKLIKLGGPAATLSAALIAAHRGLAINLAAKVAESSLGSAATLAIACLAPSLEWGVSLTQAYLADDIARPALRLVDGRVGLPSGPGLGLEVDEAAVARFRQSLR